MQKYKITFYPDNKSIEVPKDTTILSAALSAGVYINSACGGDGVCGRCKVILKKGTVLMQSSGMLTSEEKQRGIYLACISAIQSDLEAEIPPESKVDYDGLAQQSLRDKEKTLYSQVEEVEPVKAPGEETFSGTPLAVKLYLELPVPTINDKVSDVERLVREVKRVGNFTLLHIGLANIRSLSELLRSSEWKVTVTLGLRSGLREVILVEPGDTSAKNYGLCFDIGTTTLSGQLVDLSTKNILGTKIAYNKQASFGSDVITRIIYSREPDGLEKLHSVVTQGLNEIAQELIQEHKIDLNDVTAVVCAGNTTMTHLLLRIDPTYLRRDPYVPTANFVPAVRSQEAGIKINPRGLLSVIPGVASYVGGDVVAGILACGMDREEELCVLIDIGTNGEVVLGNKEFLISCAASAGPAFEGSGVSCGMRATKGAIQDIHIDPKDYGISLETIGKAEPRGICGSGYIALISELLRAGILDKDGKIKDIKHRRIRSGNYGNEFIVAFVEEAEASEDIVITEADIENIKRAKAAIYSAVAIMLRHMKLDLNQVRKIFIAGGFGTSLDVSKAIAIGLLPPIEHSRFVFVGNSSLAGSREVLLSSEAMTKTEEIARKVTYLELSVEPSYMDEYMAALFFPHTNVSLFRNNE